MILQLQHNKRELSATACCPARIWNFIGVKFWTFETTFVLVFDQWQATERICDYYDTYSGGHYTVQQQENLYWLYV